MAVIPEKAVTERRLLRLRPGRAPQRVDDAIAVEEPLEIRVAGEPVAITMRTPGDDPKLAIGFLYSEGIVDGADDLGTVSHCGHPGDEGYGNVIDCIPAPGASLQLERVQASRRGTLTTAACGVCGRRSIEDLLARCGPVPPGPPIAREVLGRATGALRDVQRIFELTGGTHAAAVLSAEGEPLDFAEDVGRHNAVDKVVGALVLKGLRAARGARPPQAPEGPAPAILAVSGRASFEMVQKAARARIPVVASVSASTSLAIDLAEKVGLTLATFVRDGGLNLCTHPERAGEGA